MAAMPAPANPAPPPPRPLLRLQTLDRGDGLLGVRRHGRLGPRGAPLSLMQLFLVDEAGGPPWPCPPEGHAGPHGPWIQQLLALGAQPLRADHLQWRQASPPSPGRAWTLLLEDDFGDFVTDVLPRLAAEGWVVERLPGFRHEPQPVSAWHLGLAAEDGQDEAQAIGVPRLAAPRQRGSWLLSLGLEVQGERLDLAPLMANLLRRDKRWLDAVALEAIEDDEVIFLRAPGGRRFHTPAAPLKQLMRHLLSLVTPRQLEGGGALRLSRWQAQQLALFEEERGRWQFHGRDVLEALVARLHAAGRPVVAPQPAGLGLRLRDYQRQGVGWLQYLGQQGLGGILADDMGLGKTAQTLAHLWLEQQAGRLARGALLVMPTSLLFNWAQEAARVTPGLRVATWHGTPRGQVLPDCDLLLCSYGLVWRDLRVLSGRDWDWLVLDEGQAVKNAASRTARALRRLPSRQRLVLSGTPLENHLGELWAHVDFLMPGYLGDARSFTRHWRKPIEEGGDGRRARWLAARVRPFLLRRLKDEVAPELPPLTELQVRLTLPMPQRQLYESVRVAADHMVRRILARQGLEGGLISVLDAMLRLRQLCCDPRLIEEIPPNLGEGVKLAWLREHLPDLLRQGRRVLVFSQFARMLDLVDGLLRELGLPALRLSGETPESQRGARVARFQAGECPLMLLSLKAGGVGLNLTAADTVIHLDPWWNPAVQAQASARAHRIGQDKPVFVHHLLVQGSIEERILALQARKKALAEGVMGVDGAAELLKFSAADLDGLLAPLPEAMDGMDGTGGGPDDAEFPS